MQLLFRANSVSSLISSSIIVVTITPLSGLSGLSVVEAGSLEEVRGGDYCL
jgi:hypothetical protein